MKKEYEIVKRNDGLYAVCEYRYMDHSLNTKQVFVSSIRKECNEYMKELKKDGIRKNK